MTWQVVVLILGIVWAVTTLLIFAISDGRRGMEAKRDLDLYRHGER